ncbi:hypothetical protein [Campylobacter fetus]|uniref:hypothetical protein n=1 Tax=Campylobacter fetus TaxID=196 RepID=UPI0008189B98|nr:hypothetical protein [Campylobacter fetus]OCR84629.1 hypothetical protein CFT12S05168_08900 [Campylobacter fetus subsp. testudinum]OCR95656.1 hypothetical protein CFT12S02847_07540 [Campylobacter fetus subsp. testudinum]
MQQQSKIIQDLKKEYKEKVKKAKIKEKEIKNKLEKKFAENLITELIKNTEFRKDLLTIIYKYKLDNFKKTYDELHNIFVITE